MAVLADDRDRQPERPDAMGERIVQEHHLQVGADRQLAPLERQHALEPLAQDRIDIDVVVLQVLLDPRGRIGEPDIGVDRRARAEFRRVIDDVVDS